MKKVLIRVLVGLYIVIAVIVTFNLLTYNRLHISEFNNKSFVKLEDNVGNYKKGNLLVIDKSNEFAASDNVFYCDLKKDKCVITYGKVDTVMSGVPMINGQTITSNYIIGKDVNVRSFPVIGSILNVLESRWVYLVFVVIPVLVGFVYLLRSILKESKK